MQISNESKIDKKERLITFSQAIREGLIQSMQKNPDVFAMGLGATDPKGVFGTTLGLEKMFGSNRVYDMPISENAMTGIAIGAAISGMRPVMVAPIAIPVIQIGRAHL